MSPLRSRPRTLVSDAMAPSSIARLNDDNYAEWVVGIEALLTRKGLWEVTSAPATDTRPNGSDNTKAVRSWSAKIAEARAELILNIEPTQYAHVQSTDAHEVWSELRRVHLARGFGTRLAHRRALWRMCKRPDQSMTSYIADVRRAAFRLRRSILRSTTKIASSLSRMASPTRTPSSSSTSTRPRPATSLSTTSSPASLTRSPASSLSLPPPVLPTTPPSLPP